MKRERFLSILEAYGADPRRWPADEREAAEAFAAEPEAAPLLREAETTDRLLDESRPLAPSTALRGRVVAAAPRPPASQRRFGWWAPGAGLAAAGVAGLVFGASLLAPRELQTDAVFAEAYSYEALVEPVEGQL